MTGDMAFVFGVLGVAVVLFASGRVRLDVVALLVLLALMLGSIVSVPEALAGFSKSVVIMIAGLFVVGEALVTTGVAFAVGDNFFFSFVHNFDMLGVHLKCLLFGLLKFFHEPRIPVRTSISGVFSPFQFFNALVLGLVLPEQPQPRPDLH